MKISIFALVIIFIILKKGWKAWYKFHKVVGIHPKKVTTSPKYQLELLQPHLNPEYIQYLPTEIKIQLKRINDKIAVYQQWKTQNQQDNKIIINDEEIFLLDKLIKEHLPEVLKNYHDIYKRQINIHQPSQNLQQAQSLMIESLNEIENKYDVWLNNIEQAQLQQLQIMQRYLKNR